MKIVPSVTRAKSLADEFRATGQLSCTHRMYDAGASLFDDGACPNEIFLIEIGWACAQKTLATGGRQIVNGAGIQIDVETLGDAVTLSEVVEENLLRIGQEAITNVVKHSGATHVRIELEYTPKKVVLRIRGH